MKELLELHIKNTDSSISEIKDSVKQLNKKVDGLAAWKWKVIGFSSASIFFGGIIMALIKG